MNAPVIPLRQIAADGILRQNVVTVRLLALCPMLAVSVSTAAAAVLAALTALVMALAGFIIAALRRHTPDAVRLPVFLTLVAALVALADIAAEALAPAMHRQLGIFLPLIVTNCAVLARLELFAAKQPPAAAFMDGAACGAGMALALVCIAAARELLGKGQIAGFPETPLFAGVPSALLPVGGFIVFAFALALLRRLKIAAA